MTDLDRTREQMFRDLKRHPLNLGFAKFEILLGLIALAIGQVLILWAVRQTIDWGFLIGGVMLFSMGGYLAMAGHRSHLYQSANDQTAYLLHKYRMNKSSSNSGEEHA